MVKTELWNWSFVWHSVPVWEWSKLNCEMGYLCDIVYQCKNGQQWNVKWGHFFQFYCFTIFFSLLIWQEYTIIFTWYAYKMKYQYTIGTCISYWKFSIFTMVNSNVTVQVKHEIKETIWSLMSSYLQTKNQRTVFLTISIDEIIVESMLMLLLVLF